MAQFRNKRIVIEAAQWFKNGDHPNDYLDARPGMERSGPDDRLGRYVEYSGAHAKAQGWEGGVVRYYRHPGVDGETICVCGHRMHDHGWIDDALGETVCPGDFVITNTNGTHSTCNPVVFHLNYEPA